ncbi:ATP-grasp domain-containing protein [Methyloceanibacter sp.]|uniref:ATP-grasp domain-containing protein n=1 Tax=Methyloceanibacter sp. TaxID=1965321 RepID=UPI002D6B5C54|nr:ATP-grasp domain-containing protein [Methyloceanibacter sp.]HZP09176.1 ATP-grasp domain-containing protein [Methyloceanibacter sp.]
MKCADGSYARGTVHEARTILVVSATHRDHREIRRLFPSGIDFRFHDYASTCLEELITGNEREGDRAEDPHIEVGRILAGLDGTKVAAVVSTDDYPGAALAAIIAQELGLPGPDPRAVLIAQHKYLSRLKQVEAVPEAVPPFFLIDTAEGAELPEERCFPLFVKPVKSFFSVGAEKVASRAELVALLPRWRNCDEFFLPLERMLERYVGGGIGSERLIAEGVLEGVQVTVEGYAFGGRATVMGVVDSIMFPGTIAFSRFDYPSRLPEDVQARMADIAAKAMEALGFDNGLFNIEMMYDARSNRVSIIEINPRMASQFADLYEKVDGTSSYRILLDIAEGREPRFTRREGRHPFASSCVLRTFEDKIVARLPGEEELTHLEALHPDIRVELHGQVGQKLSDELQDGHSYRYGIVNLGGHDLADVLAKFEAVNAMLGIVLIPAEASERPSGAELAVAAG